MEAGNLECKNLRPVTPTEFHPCLFEGEGLAQCKRKPTLLPFESHECHFRSPPGEIRGVWYTQRVHTLRISSWPTSPPSKSRTRRLLNGSGKREETRVDVCFLKFVHALFCSRFVPRVILREIEVWGRRWKRAVIFFLFRYFIFQNINTFVFIFEMGVEVEEREFKVVWKFVCLRLLVNRLERGKEIGKGLLTESDLSWFSFKESFWLME